MGSIPSCQIRRPSGVSHSTVPMRSAEPGVAFLAPLDPVCWDRDLLRRLFDFDYIWEVYVPEPKRRWGYYVLPILYGDRLVGRIEPRLERRARTLRIVDMWWEPGFEPLDVGDLKHARTLEGMAWINISLNMENGWPWQSAWRLERN